MEAESYKDEATAEYINHTFIPFTINIKDDARVWQRFGAVWTPTILILDASGVERYRIEGYLPRDEFRARLQLGYARVAFIHKRWEEAEKRYAEAVDKYPNTHFGAEALYYRNVSRYQASHDPAPLQEVAAELKTRYPDSIWTQEASVWAG